MPAVKSGSNSINQVTADGYLAAITFPATVGHGTTMMGYSGFTVQDQITGSYVCLPIVYSSSAVE